MELTDNDKNRIEQEAIVYTEGHGSTHKNWRGFIDGYEAATLYERQQQAKRIEELEDAIKSRNILQAEDKEQIKKLEGLLIRFINESQEVKTAPFHYLELMRETFKAALNL